MFTESGVFVSSFLKWWNRTWTGFPASFLSPTQSTPARPLPGTRLSFPPPSKHQQFLPLCQRRYRLGSPPLCGLTSQLSPLFSTPSCTLAMFADGLIFAEFGYQLCLFVIIVMIMSQVILPFQAHLPRSHLSILWSPRRSLCALLFTGSAVVPSLSLSFGEFLTP